MKFRCLLAALALTTAAASSEAGPLRRRAKPVYQPSYQPVYQAPLFAPPAVTPSGVIVNPPAPVATPSVEYVSHYTPVAMPDSGVVVNSNPVVTVRGTNPDPAGLSAGDGLDEVNAKRMARGLRPFLRDEGLTQAARACAQFRAANGLFGHTGNDFAFLPPGASAASAGCAAYPAGFGWMSCCVYDNYTYAGAAWVTGADGRRYMHLFVR